MQNSSIGGVCLTDTCADIYGDILSQAVTGELIGMLNFTSLVDLYESAQDKMDAVEHAFSECTHARAFSSCAAELGIPLKVDLDAPYWARIRATFLEWAKQGDLVACILAQELMLESFAISLYRSVGEKALGSLGQVFLKIAQEEAGHLEHAIEFLKKEYDQSGKSFEDKVGLVHAGIMVGLSEMTSKKDARGHCGLCKEACVKESLPKVELDIVTMKGRALQHYLKTLDRLGLPGERSLKWVAQLPV